MHHPRILLIDDKIESSRALSKLLMLDGYRVNSTQTGEEAFELLKKTNYDLIISDLLLPGVSGMDILKQVKIDSPGTSVILITGNASAETAVEAMKAGALDYISKPFNFERLRIQVAKALEKNRLVTENQYLRRQLHGRYRFDNIIGISQAMQQVFIRMEKVASTDSTILILGASGTGKELVAKAIHYNSPRAEHPFVAINCGAIPADLLESELFGHIKGSFTGAVADKPGKFELANGGTLFLDEIGNMPLQLQMKLLRVLQEHEFERVGSSKKIRLNIRLISATNTDLQELVKSGNFREDLYYRLNVIPIHLPLLRERRGDISLLTRYFLEISCREMKRKPISINAAALQAMENYSWPGNVRELENVVERTVALTDSDVITCQDLPPDIAAPCLAGGISHPEVSPEGIDLNQTLAEIERQLIHQALELGQGIKARAATLLSINRTTLVEKIKRLKIENR
ncbi:sigma-54-dependent transcriptional regulator [Pelovirga terrestris]|uniref:Sigma-54-dependent Fis family transcriptional regulator n=1 Tax=Pelovirga terrestris TaxID=2771352 RepID=A0A8J6QWT5_9BACT|nr:sigma-54 dependent transcriptional regulator [Pelovirga terrestris]MBD1399462.1 sigma-54-dependent Fis family transcriptional regulator [Pelovirga terrestris]